MRGVIDDSKLQNIADAIREKTGTDKTYEPEAMPEGVAEVYEAGQNKEWSDFWDALQGKGARTDYYYGFYSEYFGAWNDKNFKPKYDFKPTDMSRFMRRANVTDLVTIFENQGITLDTSNSSKFSLAFANMTSLKRFPTLNLTKLTADNHSLEIFSYCTALYTIEKLITAETTPFSSTFYNCVSLKNITFEGIIGRSISFSFCPLTVESMISVITHLKDYSADTTNAGKYTLTLKDSCKTLMAEQGAIEELGGKTYDQYITDIGWNLA